jgi:FAD/FMN-containing dehydrogenase
MQPIGDDIDDCTVVLADGSVVRCSREERSELFGLVVGGYGLFGVVVAATLRLGERRRLERLVDVLDLDDAMNAFTRKLATISQRASGITAVVTTIAKVAEQTNLLSVNATIEAEKAGESGRGFRIVAQEIRRLADQTALATKDIERMVRDMQAAVAGGTMEMDRFRNEVNGRIGEVAEVSEKLGRVIEPVQSVTHALEQVHDHGFGAVFSREAKLLEIAVEGERVEL